MLELAATWHDGGKLDGRFQQFLRHGDEIAAAGEAIAKSASVPISPRRRRAIREAVGLPDPLRHEALSMQLAERHAPLPPEEAAAALALHLIASHHGYARPFFPASADPAPPELAGHVNGTVIHLSAAERCALAPPHRLDAGVAERFWQLTSLVEAGETSARLSWRREASWQAVLTGLRDPDPKQLCATLAEALRGKSVAPEADDARAAADKEYKRIKTRFKKAVEAFKKRGLRGSVRTEARALKIAPPEHERSLARSDLLERLSAAVPRLELAIGQKIDLTGQEFHECAADFLATDDPAARSALSLLAGFAVEGAAEERAARTAFDFWTPRAACLFGSGAPVDAARHSGKARSDPFPSVAAPG